MRLTKPTHTRIIATEVSMKVYVMRHGTTVWNEKGIVQGLSNNRLSKSGIELTKKVAVAFKQVPIDAIICSPLCRTVQTANLMNKYHNVKIFKDKNIIEIDQGIFTGRHKDTISSQEWQLKNARSSACLMESCEHLYERVKHFVNTLKFKYSFNTVLVITHSCVATMLEQIFLNSNIDPKQISIDRTFDNAEIKLFEI